MKALVLVLVATMTLAMPVSAQKSMHVQQTADSIVKYQMKSGGWPKNQDWLKGPDVAVMKECRRTGIGSTIDNGATTSEMRVLAEAVDRVEEIKQDGYGWVDNEVLEESKKTYVDAFKRGLDYLLDMQYANGGFPQFYPEKKKDDYSAQITFNDDAMVNVLRLLKDVAENAACFVNLHLDRSAKRKCQAAYEKGMRCILDCQIRVDASGRVLAYGSAEWATGRRTVWCQQHDKTTLAPTKARAYELPSYTGSGETVGILDLLLDEKRRTLEMQEALDAGVKWLESHVMKDTEVEHFTDEEGRDDIRLVKKEGSELWARYYDLETGEPMYCDRDGVPRKQLSEIGYERRNGYQWVGTSPRKVLDKYYEK